MVNNLRSALDCLRCEELSLELQQLQQASKRQAKQDHDQCMAMFQRLQQLVQLNQSLVRNTSHSSGSDLESVSVDAKEQTVTKREVTDNRDTQVRRLQAIIVQQAKELESLQRKQQDTLADGRIRHSAMAVLPLADNQHEEDDYGRALGHPAENENSGAVNSNDNDEDDVRVEDTNRPAVKRHINYLRRLPLTSLHAKLKNKDLQVRHLQQVVAKMETRLGQLIDRKRSMAQTYQHTAKTQQAHLRKYLAHIQQQAAEKKTLERQVHDLNQYVSVLEKRIVDSTAKAALRYTSMR